MARTALAYVTVAIGLAGQPAGLGAQMARAAADSATGARLFRSNCAPCHGIDAIGGRGPNLAMGRFRTAVTDSTFLEVITKGIPGTAMWAAASLRTAQEQRQILAYVRSLARNQSALAGDSARGAALFAGKGGCPACHSLAGSGGTIGPDLTDIGWKRGPARLRESVLAPNATVEPFWFQVTVTDGGRTFTGRLMGEDTYSVRMLDAQGQLRGFRRADVEEVAVSRQSLMPGVLETFTPDEVDDLVAFLSSLRGGTR